MCSSDLEAGGDEDELVGYHLERASRYLAELGTADEALSGRAAAMLAAAGRRAFARDDARAAVSLFLRACELLPSDDAARLEPLRRASLALWWTGNVDEARRLLDTGYREFKAYQLAGKGDVVADAAIWGGAKNMVGVTVKEPLRVMMPVTSRRDMKVTLRYDGPVRAPVAAGQQIGTLTVSVPGKPDKVVPAVAAEAVPSNSFLDKMMMGLQVLVFGADKV